MGRNINKQETTAEDGRFTEDCIKLLIYSVSLPIILLPIIIMVAKFGWASSILGIALQVLLIVIAERVWFIAILHPILYRALWRLLDFKDEPWFGEEEIAEMRVREAEWAKARDMEEEKKKEEEEEEESDWFVNPANPLSPLHSDR